MDVSLRYEIRLAPQAEQPFLALPITERRHIRSVIEGLAEVTALSPPHFPSWFQRFGLAPPLMRLNVAGLQISYELDLDGRALRICAVETAAELLRRAAQAMGPDQVAANDSEPEGVQNVSAAADGDPASAVDRATEAMRRAARDGADPTQRSSSRVVFVY